VTSYQPGQWMPITTLRHRRYDAIGKPQPPAKRKNRDTKPKRRKRRKRNRG
jgi:hypothetical protein